MQLDVELEERRDKSGRDPNDPSRGVVRNPRLSQVKCWKKPTATAGNGGVKGVPSFQNGLKQA